MRFVVDETSWNFDGLEPELCIEALEAMLDLIDDAHAQGHGVCFSDELFQLPVRDGCSFYELYRDEFPLPIPDEVRIRVSAAFAHLPFWQDLDAQLPDSFDVSVGGGPLEFAPSVAWAHAQRVTNKKEAVACISHPIRRVSGEFDVSISSVSESIWFVSTPKDIELFFRWLIINATDNPAEMAELSPYAFEALSFVDGVFGGIKDMSKSYRLLAPKIVEHLAALSDEGARIFSGTRDRVSNEFGSLGVDISDENGNTKGNAKARTERTLLVDGELRLFWWHTKLELHQDRIHICPEKVREGGRILIGIFCRHLTV